MLTAEFLREILDYNPETGLFTWKVRKGGRPQWNATYAGKTAGSIKADGRVMIAIGTRKTKLYRAHRLAWLYMTGEWPKDQIDHIDGDPTNNRFANLREATCAENQRNRPAQSNGSSGVKGLSWHKAAGKWHARVTVRGKTENLGLFVEKERAIDALIVARNRLHGDFARHT
jgi:hypothetical protein